MSDKNADKNTDKGRMIYLGSYIDQHCILFVYFGVSPPGDKITCSINIQVQLKEVIMLL